MPSALLAAGTAAAPDGHSASRAAIHRSLGASVIRFRQPARPSDECQEGEGNDHPARTPRALSGALALWLPAPLRRFARGMRRLLRTLARFQAAAKHRHEIDDLAGLLVLFFSRLLD